MLMRPADSMDQHAFLYWDHISDSTTCITTKQRLLFILALILKEKGSQSLIFNLQCSAYSKNRFYIPTAYLNSLKKSLDHCRATEDQYFAHKNALRIIKLSRLEESCKTMKSHHQPRTVAPKSVNHITQHLIQTHPKQLQVTADGDSTTSQTTYSNA